MEGLGKHHSSSEGKRVVGHSLVQGLYMLLGRRCPLAPQLYRQQSVCEKEGVVFQSKIALMLERIRTFEPVPGTQYQLMSAIAILRFWTLALAADTFLDEQREQLQAQEQRHVTIGEARREVQHVHQRHLIQFIYERALAGVALDDLYTLLAV